ncbi:MAG: hypothetical protein F6K08_22735 [Okeania sp. SIO1H6]|nr:hypothetical protein [Okeania sp. SIO1H6]
MKARIVGIKVIENEESYASKTSTIGLEKSCQNDTYLGNDFLQSFKLLLIFNIMSG